MKYLCRLLPFLFTGASTVFAAAAEPYRIEVVEKGSGWPVPLVELRTTSGIRSVTDNAGLIAFDAPEFMNRPTWFDVQGYGYEVPADGFGIHGVRLVPEPGQTKRIEVTRTNIARRLGRLTGGGIFAESQRLGLRDDWKESGVFGCDSVQNAVHQGRMFWIWGDTNIASYPLGIFNGSAATTAFAPLQKFEPPLELTFDYFRDKEGKPVGVADIPGEGPTWLSGVVSLPDREGTRHLVASYIKVKPPMDAYASGLCVWNEKRNRFENHKTIWTRTPEAVKAPRVPDGHPVNWKDEQGKEWILFGNPFPTLRCPATYEAWQHPGTWEELTPQASLVSSSDGAAVKPHSGSIAYNSFRKRWVTVFMQSFGKPSVFGELWYAEADSPSGSWGPAVKIISHDNYTFYNPRLHPEFTTADSPILIFEGTFTQEFADHPQRVPRYDYNQILYRLDLDDADLTPAHASAAKSP